MRFANCVTLFSAIAVLNVTTPGAVTFTERLVSTTAPQAAGIVASDVDGDGDTDLFSANFNDEGIAFYENNGQRPPSWTKQVISAFWVGAWGVHAADVDGDGDIDGIGGLTNTACGPPIACVGVEVYESNGASPPSFTIRAVSPGLVGASTVRTGDLDGDGDTDIVTPDTANDRLLWFENNGAHPPVWTQHVLTTSVDDPWAADAADIDRDGDVDVVSASYEDDQVAWHENDGATPPAWTSRTIPTTLTGFISIHAADLDGDGDADLIAGSWDDARIAWYENSGGSPPAFTEHIIAMCAGPESVTAARVDSDVDVVCAANFSPGKVHLFENGENFAEADGDGVRDNLDCAPGDATAFALPDEVRDLRFPAPAELAWKTAAAASGSGTVHDVLQGPLPGLPVGSDAGEICLAEGTPGSSLTVSAEPAIGTAFFYLVRRANACGVGSYGFEHSGAERESTACP